MSAWKQQHSCIPCHFLTAKNTELQLTFALYFLYVSETNLITLWFCSYLLFVLKDTDFVSFTFSTGSTSQGLFHDPITLDSLPILLSHPSSTLTHLHRHSSSPNAQDYNGTTNNRNIYMFGAFVSISQSSFVSLFCFTVIPMEGNLSNKKNWSLFHYSAINQTSKRNLKADILLRFFVFKKIPWTLS